MSKYNRQDHYYLKAKDEGYRSRASYKLIELNKKFNFFKRGSKVIDLGCFPGGWMQVALENIGSEGFVIGIDLKEVEPLVHRDSKKGVENSAFIIKGNINDQEIKELCINTLDGYADVILSDLSPSLSGIKFKDAFASAELVKDALVFSIDVLKDGGDFVAKIFPGADADEVSEMLRDVFTKFKREKLKSTRGSSNEFYLVGKGFDREKAKSIIDKGNTVSPEWSPI